ncbi:hypothetical protein B0T09DRAFT_367050 [Sordaria sp. MPI-SDFR-AT-0083]|nr:hypothetical protein B0T09DRAFT_367050 [Sordaria sp. MPI-SDFR-AT-0083]
MCLEKRKLYTVCGHVSSGVRLCEQQRQLEDAFEAPSPSNINGSGSGVPTTSKIFFCPRLSSLINPSTPQTHHRPPPFCRLPYPYFTETRFGFCGRCQAYYRSTSSSFAFPPHSASSADTEIGTETATETGICDDQCVPGKVIFDKETEYKEDPKVQRGEIIMLERLVPFCGEDVGGRIMKLEDIRWKTIMWGEEGRKKMEWKGELEGEKEQEEQEDEEKEKEDEEKERQEYSGPKSREPETSSPHSTAATATDSDVADELVKRALTSSYHNVLARLAMNASDHQSYLSSIHSQETHFSQITHEEYDGDERKRLINNTTKAADLQPEFSASEVEDIYKYDYQQFSEITEERTSQYTKSQPFKELASQPSSDSFPGIVTSLSPIPRKKTAFPPRKQSSSNHNSTHSVRLTKSNLARFIEGTDSGGGKDETLSTSTVRVTIQPPHSPTAFSVAAAVSTRTTTNNFVNSSLPGQPKSKNADSQTTSPVSTAQFRPSPSLSHHLLSPSRAPCPANATVGGGGSIQSWEDFTISTPSQSIHSSWREGRQSQVTETGRNGSGSSVALGLGQLILATNSPNLSPNTSGRNTPRLRRTPRIQGTPRLQALHEDIYLNPEQEHVDDDSGSGLGAPVFGELAAGIVEKENDKTEGKGKDIH